jgi:hypothetical protein
MTIVIPDVNGTPAQTFEVDAGLGNAVLHTLVKQAYDDVSAAIVLVSGGIGVKTLALGDSTEIGDGTTGYNYVYVSVKGDATNVGGDVVITTETDPDVVRSAFVRYDFGVPVTRVLLSASKAYLSDRYMTLSCTGYT